MEFIGFRIQGLVFIRFRVDMVFCLNRGTLFGVPMITAIFSLRLIRAPVLLLA